MRPGAGEGRGRGSVEPRVSFSDTDMKPSVFWQNSAFYRGQKDTGGPQSQAHMPVCCWTAILKTQMKIFNKNRACGDEHFREEKEAYTGDARRFPVQWHKSGDEDT